MPDAPVKVSRTMKSSPMPSISGEPSSPLTAAISSVSTFAGRRTPASSSARKTRTLPRWPRASTRGSAACQIYDPTTGQIRNSSTDDIACWFIDTNYNGESFFVRHAYFTGAGEPYEKLQRALRTEIDEAAWQSLYSTTSRPFDKPATGKIALKVINHYGDEVLKVFETRG
jgi:hypothetical protein